MPGRGSGTDPPARKVTFCVVPADLAASLHEPLRRHFSNDPSVEVVVEERSRDRRRTAERRCRAATGPAARADRRRVQSTRGRRVAERRAPVTVVDATRPLPRRAAPYRERLVFVERLEPSTLVAEDRDTARLVVRFQRGDESVFNPIYMRYFDRVYAHLGVVLRDPHEAEDATQEVFMRVLRALPQYELRPDVPFRGWLFTIARNHARDLLKRSRRLDLEDPSAIDRRRELDRDAPDLSALDWVTNRELVMLIERLPLAQRQVLILRYLVQLRNDQIAAVLERTPESVRKLHERAIAFLEERLTALGRRSQGAPQRPGMKRAFRQAVVLRRRRFALLSR